MEVGKLTVEYRNAKGKNVARRLRAAGKVPGICYGLGQDPLPISLDPKALRRALDPEKKRNTVIRMTVEGAAGGTKEVTVMLKDYQVDTLRSTIQHVDLVQVDTTKDVEVAVPVILQGRPKGVVDGGQLNTAMRELEVRCKPEAIPAQIVCDISRLDLGDVLHVGEIELPPGVTAVPGPKAAICSIVAPQAEKTAGEEAAEAAAVEGAEPGAEGEKKEGDKGEKKDAGAKEDKKEKKE